MNFIKIVVGLFILFSLSSFADWRICTTCAGKGKISPNGYWVRCETCFGTGVEFFDLNGLSCMTSLSERPSLKNCRVCGGYGRLANKVRCSSCNGTGRWIYFPPLKERPKPTFVPYPSCFKNSPSTSFSPSTSSSSDGNTDFYKMEQKRAADQKRKENQQNNEYEIDQLKRHSH